MQNNGTFAKLVEGQTVVFKVVPLGSYTKPNEPYKVESKGDNSAYFRNVKTGGGTFDSAKMINYAVLA